MSSMQRLNMSLVAVLRTAAMIFGYMVSGLLLCFLATPVIILYGLNFVGAFWERYIGIAAVLGIVMGIAVLVVFILGAALFAGGYALLQELLRIKRQKRFRGLSFAVSATVVLVMLIASAIIHLRIFPDAFAVNLEALLAIVFPAVAVYVKKYIYVKRVELTESRSSS